MFKQILKSTLPQEVVALLEKIESYDSKHDSSYYRAWDLVAHGDFRFHERLILRRALHQVTRRSTLREAMCVVINAPQDNDEFIREVPMTETNQRRKIYDDIKKAFDGMAKKRKAKALLEETRMDVELTKNRLELRELNDALIRVVAQAPVQTRKESKSIR